MRACQTCSEYLSANWHNLRGACASVGIEHGRSTDDVLADYMRSRHQRECLVR